MNFLTPEPNVFTIYSKSGCPNCLKVKNLLKENKLIFTIIDCDEYIIEDKVRFLLFMKDFVQSEAPLQFPFVFNDGQYIGGYKETQKYVEQLFLSFDKIAF
jgi:glutaredoxin